MPTNLARRPREAITLNMAARSTPLFEALGFFFSKSSSSVVFERAAKRVSGSRFGGSSLAGLAWPTETKGGDGVVLAANDLIGEWPTRIEAL